VSGNYPQICSIIMSRLLLKNIRSLAGVYDQPPEQLAGAAMGTVPLIEDAWLAVEEGRVADFGRMEDFPGIADWKGLEVADCSGKLVLPGFVDSHTHIVYAGNREREFVDRIRGLSYEEIAARGGGIINSSRKLRKTPEDELFSQSLARLREIISQGTVAVEIKSGYGLDTESELKMLRVIRRLRELNLIPVKATFLGAHAVPPEFRENKKGYIELITREMLPAIAAEGLADFIDVFCEKNYFTEAETIEILEAGAKFGLKGKVHAEQLSHSGGARAGASCGARTVDHLEYLDDEDIRRLKEARTMPVILPGAAFFLNLPFPPARKIIDSGLPMAIASDYNPGSSPSGNMKLMMSLSCIQYRLSPEEAFNAATLNGAWAMDLAGVAGAIVRGGRADFIITREAESVTSLAYAFGSGMIEAVYLGGKKF
jgi:imidazolonepropionase